ncbi:MAG: uroporphyrinogen decarboxylase family protein [bacterium]
MKQDALNFGAGSPTVKRVSKETLNHRGLVELVSGLDAYAHTAEAYRRAYEALGIDLINRVPLENAPPPTPPGERRTHSRNADYDLTALGVYDTASRRVWPCREPDDLWRFDVAGLRYEQLVTPVPHPVSAADARARQAALGEIGLYYPMLYTTLFMWPVETFGWELFMLAAAEAPARFAEHVLKPCAAKSTELVAELARTDLPFVFVHDDLASATGPVLAPAWYDEFIFPLYPAILAPARGAGKKVILVADGNMTAFLPRITELFDGFMCENPATPLEAVIEYFGRPGKFLIGGIETVRLAIGAPAEVRDMVLQLHAKTRHLPGFAMASCGGLHGDIPLANLEAYFDARAAIGVTPRDWRTRCRKEETP